MKCSVCDKTIRPIWSVGRDIFYRQCDTCLENVCENCSDEDDDGIVECLSCIQQRKINESIMAIL